MTKTPNEMDHRTYSSPPGARSMFRHTVQGECAMSMGSERGTAASRVDTLLASLSLGNLGIKVPLGGEARDC
jgi:hypothetical protein